ncbi:MAG TPA: metalloregulator ArsR/SmtB family transcription factor [Spirochaetota bacterium]|nr:metalloregulator ArsR/SmtB family transcription factor [Spirochaetota bacterium]HOL56552.1 metalloregulator ArsR/SmtB family transcription factor [Spirochaetota bacterium]HPP03985.1 metalloregulator ArsR/SmtB family transcription factor [Spirochaetota bacterium]
MTDKDITLYAEIFKALGHPTRLAIVRGLIENKVCNVNKIVEKLGVSQSTVSQHLGLLRRTKIVQCEKKGLEVCYKVENEKIKKIIEIIEQ